MTNRRWIVSFALDLLLVSSFVAANRYQLRGRFDGESWNPQSPLSLATGSEASHQGIRRLLETGEMPNITETEPLSCLAVNGRISCTLAFAVNDPGTNDSSEMSVTTNCPGTDVDNFNLREAEGCFCQAQVSRDNTNGDACLCSICNDDRSEALVSVDCTPFGATVIDSCGSLDCNYGCNGNCISSCPAEAAQDPECPFCFVTESPSTTLHRLRPPPNRKHHPACHRLNQLYLCHRAQNPQSLWLLLCCHPSAPQLSLLETLQFRHNPLNHKARH